MNTMQDSGYTNPKMEFIKTVFGPAMDFLERHNISGGWLEVGKIKHLGEIFHGI